MKHKIYKHKDDGIIHRSKFTSIYTQDVMLIATETAAFLVGVNVFEVLFVTKFFPFSVPYILLISVPLSCSLSPLFLCFPFVNTSLWCQFCCATALIFLSSSLVSQYGQIPWCYCSWCCWLSMCSYFPVLCSPFQFYHYFAGLCFCVPFLYSSVLP